MLNFYRKLQKF